MIALWYLYKRLPRPFKILMLIFFAGLIIESLGVLIHNNNMNSRRQNVHTSPTN
jgi:uncharacterized membrane protein